MGRFQTTMSAEVRVPQDGFTMEEFKAHLRESKVPAGSRLKPAIVKVVEPGYVTGDGDTTAKPDTEVAFIAEWSA